MISCFNFRYAQSEYFILLKRYESRPPEYALLEIFFVDRANLDRTLCAPANTKRLIIDARSIREYFDIKWSENLGEVLSQLTAAVGNSLPATLPADFSAEQDKAMVHHLSRSDSEDPAKVYCIGTQLNPKKGDGIRGKRSSFNSQKTEILRPTLYNALKSEESLSFCYSADVNREVSDADIFERLATRRI